jgi:predicted DNA-binding transcriptional regulator YafY
MSEMLTDMFETSARLLRLLSLLQQRREWTGAELAERLEITPRTVRRDVEKLRGLGYPINAAPGVTGGYQLGAGAALPPLQLDDDEAVAVAIGLRAATSGGVANIAETSVRALAKLQQILPSRLRDRVTMIEEATVSLERTGPSVDADVLIAVAAACRDHHRLRFDYRSASGTESVRTTEPHRLVHTGRVWYLMAYDLDRGDWRTYRLDRMTPRVPTGPRFTPREPPADPAAYVSQSVSSSPYRYQARLRVHAPLAEVAQRTSPTASRLEAVDEETTMLYAGSNSLDELTLYIGLKGFDFDVLDPPELRTHIAELAARLSRVGP